MKNRFAPAFRFFRRGLAAAAFSTLFAAMPAKANEFDFIVDLEGFDESVLELLEGKTLALLYGDDIYFKDGEVFGYEDVGEGDGDPWEVTDGMVEGYWVDNAEPETRYVVAVEQDGKYIALSADGNSYIEWTSIGPQGGKATVESPEFVFAAGEGERINLPEGAVIAYSTFTGKFYDDPGEETDPPAFKSISVSGNEAEVVIENVRAGFRYKVWMAPSLDATPTVVVVSDECKSSDPLELGLPAGENAAFYFVTEAAADDDDSETPWPFGN